MYGAGCSDDYMTQEIIPSWFMLRMCSDEWFFGLMLTSGNVLGISKINNLSLANDGTVWIDAEMLESTTLSEDVSSKFNVITSPTSRTDVLINSNHVVMAFELADT